MKMTEEKRVICTCVFLLSICLSCGKREAAVSSSLIEFDVGGNYPEKTLTIQDVADVEYLVLQSRDSFLYTHFVYLTDQYVVAFNNSDWGYVFFDRQGNPVSRVCKAGQGPEEYMPFWIQVYDEGTDEFFVFSYPNKIQVYTKKGDYIRTLPLNEVASTAVIDGLYTYTQEYLLCHDKVSKTTPFFLISRKDGKVEPVPLSFGEKISPFLKKKMANGESLTIQFPYSYAIKEQENILLTEYSGDTFFLYTPEHRLVPKFVRKPPVGATEPPVLVHGLLETDTYVFWSTDKLEYNFATRQGEEEKGFLFDKRSNEMYAVKISNPDYEEQDLCISPATLTSRIGESSFNPRVGVKALKNEGLWKAQEAGKLHGSLQTVVDSMDEENPFVLMIMKFK